MADDNTPVVEAPKASEITDQNTLEEALKPTEPVEEVQEEAPKVEEPKKFLGKYKSEEDAQKAFANIQERARKAEEQLKVFKTEMSAKQKEEFSKMDYEKQMEFLLERNKEQEEKLNSIYSALNEQASQSGEQELDKFIAAEPLIKGTGLENEFRLLATHPELEGYTLESIFNTMLKPKVEKIMGTKIKVKERKILSDDNTPQADKYSPENVAKMSPAEYEKNRENILRANGVRI